MSVGYHGSSKMAVVATAALLSSSITASLAVLQLAAFKDRRASARHVPSALNHAGSCCAFLRPPWQVFM